MPSAVHEIILNAHSGFIQKEAVLGAGYKKPIIARQARKSLIMLLKFLLKVT